MLVWVEGRLPMAMGWDLLVRMSCFFLPSSFVLLLSVSSNGHELCPMNTTFTYKDTHRNQYLFSKAVATSKTQKPDFEESTNH